MIFIEKVKVKFCVEWILKLNISI